MVGGQEERGDANSRRLFREACVVEGTGPKEHGRKVCLASNENQQLSISVTRPRKH